MTGIKPAWPAWKSGAPSDVSAGQTRERRRPRSFVPSLCLSKANVSWAEQPVGIRDRVHPDLRQLLRQTRLRRTPAHATQPRSSGFARVSARIGNRNELCRWPVCTAFARRSIRVRSRSSCVVWVKAFGRTWSSPIHLPSARRAADGIPHLPACLDDWISAARAYAGCSAVHFADARYKGDRIRCGCSTMSWMNNRTTSLVFRPSE